MDFIPKEYALIFNNSKVIKARIFGKKESGGEVELLFLKPLSSGFLVHIRGKVKESAKLFFDDGLIAQITKLNSDGTRVVKFYRDGVPLSYHTLLEILEKIGSIPLPPYIKREATKDDETKYQSVFAEHFGSVAAPTASLHFTPELFSKVTAAHKHALVTLHVGSGTFLPVSSENILDHKMHGECYEISNAAKELCDSATPILAVGTTACRTIEEYARSKTINGECELFLHPQSQPSRINALLTNFHLPKSTLLMLVSSLLGREKTLELYSVAIKEDYRFYSYGDAMLIL